MPLIIVKLIELFDFISIVEPNIGEYHYIWINVNCDTDILIYNEKCIFSYNTMAKVCK